MFCKRIFWNFHKFDRETLVLKSLSTDARGFAAAKFATLLKRDYGTSVTEHAVSRYFSK